MASVKRAIIENDKIHYSLKKDPAARDRLKKTHGKYLQKDFVSKGQFNTINNLTRGGKNK